MKNANAKTILILTFQLVIIIVLVGFGTAYVRQLAKHSENNIKDNIRTIRYCSAMQQSLNGLHSNQNQLSLRTNFENNLTSELNNLTEPGEKELANKVQEEYFLWLKIPVDSTYKQLSDDITAVNELNISAIEKRNDATQKVAGQANTFMILLGFFGALAAFIFTFAFIGQLLKPRPRV